jgi:hypothetical protein
MLIFLTWNECLWSKRVLLPCFYDQRWQLLLKQSYSAKVSALDREVGACVPSQYGWPAMAPWASSSIICTCLPGTCYMLHVTYMYTCACSCNSISLQAIPGCNYANFHGSYNNDCCTTPCVHVSVMGLYRAMFHQYISLVWFSYNVMPTI